MRARSLLVTGGAGFVGSHFVRRAMENGSHVVVLDDLSGGCRGPRSPTGVETIKGDIADTRLVRELLRSHNITTIVHFAGKICVGESVVNPAVYFDHNLLRTHTLLEAVRMEGVRTFLFSSSAAVYGMPKSVPTHESHDLRPISPYGMSKLGVEHALEAYGTAYGLRWGALRYFNAAGAHPDGSMREDHHPETHLVPLAIDAALDRGPPLKVFGNTHATPDGTCLRDYVHVWDLAKAHLDALDAIDAGIKVQATNLGTGLGVSVLEVIKMVERVIGKSVPYSIAEARQGDPAILVADTQRAAKLLGWGAERNLETLVLDAVRSRLGVN